MPTSAPSIYGIALDSNLLSGLAGVLVGGLFSFLTTWLTLRHQSKTIRLAEMTRLRWTKRWELMYEVSSALSDAFISIRRLTILTGDGPWKTEIDEAWACHWKLKELVARSGPFLPGEIESAAEGLVEELHKAKYDLSEHAKAQTATDHGAAENRRFYGGLHSKWLSALATDGETERRIVKLRGMLRRYLDEPR